MMYIVEYEDGRRVLYDRTIETYVMYFKLIIILCFIIYYIKTFVSEIPAGATHPSGGL